jgi:hypothetical protein
MKEVQRAVMSLQHDEAAQVLEKGWFEVAREVLDATMDFKSEFEFSKAGVKWEACSKADGSLVVAVDCTQNKSTGMSREFING